MLWWQARAAYGGPPIVGRRWRRAAMVCFCGPGAEWAGPEPRRVGAGTLGASDRARGGWVRGRRVSPPAPSSTHPRCDSHGLTQLKIDDFRHALGRGIDHCRALRESDDFARVDEAARCARQDSQCLWWRRWRFGGQTDHSRRRGRAPPEAGGTRETCETPSPSAVPTLVGDWSGARAIGELPLPWRLASGRAASPGSPHDGQRVGAVWAQLPPKRLRPLQRGARQGRSRRRGSCPRGLVSRSSARLCAASSALRSRLQEYDRLQSQLASPQPMG